MLFFTLTIILVSNLFISCHGTPSDYKQVYIVYMGSTPDGGQPGSELHLSMLQKVLGREGSEPKNSLVYSYHRTFNGFAAKLTHEQMLQVSGMEGVISVLPNERHELQTTRSWNFMGLTPQVTRSNVEGNIIIGVLDTGIWPESASFSDGGFGPPPRKWKGICQKALNFSCNNKIIGAKYYRSSGSYTNGDAPSPRDMNGHGSHTASIAAGNFVHGANMAGLAMGTARGGAPTARIAVYKVCWSDGCYGADILAAFDDAIADGVDILSISIGSRQVNYFNSVIAIGAFHAMKHGVLTSAGAGNLGPSSSTIINFAPWLFTIAASTIDRKFVTRVMLGNGATYEGISINTIEGKNKMLPVIYGGNAPNISGGWNSSASRYCLVKSLDPKLVKGKVVVCDTQSSNGPARAGAAGVIMQDGYFKDVAYNYPIPASYLGSEEGFQVVKYLNKTRKPTARILKSRQQKNDLAPFVPSFSSRGPNPITSDILKPDLTAPGVDILAAWSEGTTVTGFPGDKRVVKYSIQSGTSLSCPHATGAAAFVKSFFPNWSPAAIKSALMTTATPMSPSANVDAEFAYGTGHINPVKAINPGLIYDISETQYVEFLCGQGYTARQLQIVTGNTSVTCSNVAKRSPWDLNYPSFALSGKSGQVVSRVFHRTVTNVGKAKSSYKANVVINSGKDIKVKVEPKVLDFNFANEKKSFVVTVKVKFTSTMLTGALIWDDGGVRVRSPVVAHIV